MSYTPSGFRNSYVTNHRTQLSAAALAALALFATTPARAADACQDIARASSKIWEIPVHIYTTQTFALSALKTRNSESIYTGGANGAIYILVRGAWTRSRLTTADMKAAEDSPEKTAKHTCQYVRDEAVNGEPAAVYSSHAETDAGRTDITVWISRSKNVPLKSEVDLDVGSASGAGKSHSSVRYDYTNVQPPPGVK